MEAPIKTVVTATVRRTNGTFFTADFTPVRSDWRGFFFPADAGRAKPFPQEKSGDQPKYDNHQSRAGATHRMP